MVAMADFSARSLARAFLQQRCAEDRVAFTNLGDGDFQGTDTGLEGAGLEAVGVAIALDATLVWGGSDVGFAFK
jgi:hypothetical protein